MYVIEVIPLHVGQRVPTLSYFSSVPYERGNIITIPVRARDTDAVVISSAPVSSLKTALRAATFTLRKLPPQVIVGKLSPTFMAMVDTISEERALHVSEVLATLVPKRRHLMTFGTDEDTGEREHTVALFVAPYSERIAEYQTVVREAFARGSSVLFVVPTAHRAERAVRELSQGIDDRVVVITGSTRTGAKGERVERLEGNRPLLIIVTPAFAYLERGDIGTVVIEASRAKGYRSMRKPYVDHIHALLVHARLAKRHVIIGDLVPYAEHVEAFRERRFREHGEHPKRINLPGKLTVIHQKKDHDGMVPFTLFSDELLLGIHSTLKKGGRMFLFAARRGLAPLVACADCGFIFRDPESGAPLSLYTVRKGDMEERYLYSAASGYRERMPDTCGMCNGWRLRERGIGIQFVERELLQKFPDMPLTVLDHTTATTDMKVRNVVRTFYTKEGQVLLGTALAIPYLTTPLDATGVVSMDSLLSVPSWRQQEEVFGTLMTLREKTLGPVMVQTRHRADERVLALAARGEIGAFYDEEIEARRAWSYPPYADFILLSYKGPKDAVMNTEAELRTLFLPQGIVFYGTPEAEGVSSMRRGLMRFPRGSWPQKEVVEHIRRLSPAIKVEFNPERIV
jgi:primosomal protein N'